MQNCNQTNQKNQTFQKNVGAGRFLEGASSEKFVFLVFTDPVTRIKNFFVSCDVKSVKQEHIFSFKKHLLIDFDLNNKDRQMDFPLPKSFLGWSLCICKHRG